MRADATCGERGIMPKRTRPYRPWTNGKIERFHRTRPGGWTVKTHYPSETARIAALSPCIHQYSHHPPTE